MAKPKILLIGRRECYTPLGDLFEELIKREGWESHFCSQWEEILGELEAWQPNALLIFNFRLDGGWEAWELSREAQKRNIPVLLTTLKTLSPKECKDHGITNYLYKGADSNFAEKVVSMLKDLLKTRVEA